MNELFTKEFSLRTSDFDCYDRLRPSSILDLFQNVAGEHATLLGVGRAAMLGRDLIWVLTRIRYEVCGESAPFARVRVETWPLRPGRLTFIREYRILSAEGKVLVRGSSEWVLLHTVRRRIVAVADLYPPMEHIAERNFPDGFSRLARVAEPEKSFSVMPGFSDLDDNGHVNNIRYADYVMNAYAPRREETVRCFEIEYHREVLADTPLTLFCLRSEKGFSADGQRADGELMFSCRVEN